MRSLTVTALSLLCLGFAWEDPRAPSGFKDGHHVVLDVKQIQMVFSAPEAGSESASRYLRAQLSLVSSQRTVSLQQLSYRVEIGRDRGKITPAPSLFGFNIGSDLWISPRVDAVFPGSLKTKELNQTLRDEFPGEKEVRLRVVVGHSEAFDSSPIDSLGEVTFPLYGERAKPRVSRLPECESQKTNGLCLRKMDPQQLRLEAPLSPAPARVVFAVY